MIARELADAIRDRQARGIVPFIPCDTDEVLRLLDRAVALEAELQAAQRVIEALRPARAKGMGFGGMNRQLALDNALCAVDAYDAAKAGAEAGKDGAR